MGRKRKQRAGEIAAALAGLLGGGLHGFVQGTQRREDRDLRRTMAEQEQARFEQKEGRERDQEARLQRQSESTIELNRAKTAAASGKGAGPNFTAKQKADLFGLLSAGKWDPATGQKGAVSMLEKQLQGIDAESAAEKPGDFMAMLMGQGKAAERTKRRAGIQSGLGVATGFPQVFGEQPQDQTGQPAAPQSGAVGAVPADQQAHSSMLNAYGALFTSSDPTAPQMDVLWQMLARTIGPGFVPERVRARWQGVGSSGIPNTMGNQNRVDTMVGR